MRVLTTGAIIIFIIALVLFVNPKGIEASVSVPSFNKVIDDFEKIQSYATDGSMEPNTSTVNATTQNKPVISESLQGAIVGGIIGFGSAIMTDIIKRWITRPKISISEQTIEEHIVPFPEEGGGGHQYLAIRIKVKNNGSTAAEDCKASMIVDSKEYRLAWTIPKDDHTVTINAHDREYIDLCAFDEGNLPGIEPHSLMFTTARGHSKTPGESRTFADVLRPLVLAHGEIAADAKLKVSSRNARQAVKNIRIQTEQQGDKKIVQFVYNIGLCLFIPCCRPLVNLC